MKLISKLTLLAVAGLVVATAGSASARPPYLNAFTKNYSIKPESMLGGARCNICHINGQPKAQRNQYGADLAKALGKANASDAEATAAIKKIENMVGVDKKTKYVDLIKADKNPGL